MALYLGSNQVAPTKIQDDTFGWLGANVKYEGKLYEWNGTLADTTYSSWTPSTSASTILSTLSNVVTITINGNEPCNYYAIGGWDNKFVYNSGTTLEAAATQFVSVGIQTINPYPYGEEELLAKKTHLVETSSFGQNRLKYYDTSGNLAINTVSYGPAYATTYVSSSNSQVDGIYTIQFSRPPLSARCNSSYFSTSVAPNLNLTSSTLNYRLDLFKVPIGFRTQTYFLVADKLNGNFSLN